MNRNRDGISRRKAIHRLGVLGLGAAAACGSDQSLPADDPRADGPDLPASCILAPRQTDGPYFVDTGLRRQDITEGRPGAPLTVRLQIVSVAKGCAPVPGAVVELWHADAGGVYSGFDVSDGNVADAAGETFLRGFQTTDRDGRLEFHTIYPGWYPVRTAHIHATVLIDRVEHVTTQLYFDQAANDRVYATPPYDERGPQRTRNEGDALIGDDPPMLTLRGPDDDLVASLVLGIA